MKNAETVKTQIPNEDVELFTEVMEGGDFDFTTEEGDFYTTFIFPIYGGCDEESLSEQIESIKEYTFS